MSEQAQHTPGPWTAERVPGGARVTAEDSLPVAWCGNHYSTATGYMPFEDNARLIAAAPDMLEALEAIENWRRSDPEVLKLVRGVIAKAKGIEKPKFP